MFKVITRHEVAQQINVLLKRVRRIEGGFVFCVGCKGEMKKSGHTSNDVPRWRCTECGANYLGSRKRLARLNGQQIRKPDKYAEAERLFRAGYTTRQVESEVGICKTTANHYRKEALRNYDARCVCGRPAGHKGFCWHRYQNSPKRQEFMKQWHSQTSA